MSSSLEAPSSPPSSSSPPAPQSAMTVDFSAFGLPSFVGGDHSQALYLFPEATSFSPKDQAKGPSPPANRAYDHAGDAMLSAINYGEDEVLQEGFEVPFGSLDGLLRLPPRPATAPADPSPFDLLGDNELQLSPPQAFGTATHASDTGVASSTEPPGASMALSCMGLPSDKDLGRLSPALSAAAGMRPMPKVGTTGGRAPSAQPCPVCGKVFGNSSALTKHKLTHSDERKYVCTQCQKAFKRQDHLNGHLLTHRNKKPYECDADGCDKSYCDARSLRRHKENHHASVALTLVPFQAIPLPPQLQLVAFPAEDGASVWAAQQRPLLVAPQAQSATTVQPSAAPAPSQQQQEVPVQQQPLAQRQPSPRPQADGPPLLQQLLEPSKTWTSVPAVSFPADAMNEPPAPSRGGSLPSPALETMPLAAEPECICSLCHRKLVSLSELERHMRLHQPPATTTSASQGATMFTGQVLQETCQPVVETAPVVTRQSMHILQPDEVVASATAGQQQQQRPAAPLLPPLNMWAVRPVRPSLTSTNNNERRRHSDSDHLAFESSGLLADLLLGPRRTSRVGSDPGLEPLPSFEQLQGLVASSRNSLVSSPDGMQAGMSYGDSHQHEDVFAAISDAFDEEEEEKPNKDMLSTYVASHSPHGGLSHSPAAVLMQSPASFGHEVVCVPDSPPLVVNKIKTEPVYEQADVKPVIQAALHASVPTSALTPSPQALPTAVLMAAPAAVVPTATLTVVPTTVHSMTPPPNQHLVSADASSTRTVEAPEPFSEPKKPLESSAEEAQVSSCRTAECDDDDVFLSPIPTCPLRSRRKHRPEPLYIPPHVNAIGFPSRLRSPRLWDPCADGAGCKGVAGVSSPPPYTPPPMLSPLRSGSGLFWHVFSGPRSAGPITPHAVTPRDRVSAVYPPSSGGGGGMVPQSPLEGPCEAPLSEEEGELAPETDILPHVNVGPQYQARLPSLDAEEALKSDHRADLVWDPHIGDHLADDEVENYLELACCAAVPGGGRNREYAFHVLALCQGNLQEATLRLMEREPRLPGGHPLLTYRYPECHRWSREEVERFQEGLATFDKDFLHVASKVGTKSVQQCVEFYYVWKKVAPEEYRRLRCLRRRRELDQVAPEEDDMEEAAGSPAAVASAAAKVTVPSEPVQPCEPPQEFPCRLCGRVFAKVKSRNAHMKSHGAPRSVASSRFEF